MAHRYYRTLWVGLAFLVGVGVVVGWWSPSLWTEVIANGLLLFGWVFVTSWAWGTRKYGLITAVGLWSLLLMKRFGVLDWMTFGAWLLIIGLITLVN